MGQYHPGRLRRAAVRRYQAQRVRQGAWRRGARLLYRAKERRGGGRLASSELTEDRAGGILTLRLNQPEVRNALGSAMVQALHSALARAREDTTVGAVIIAASGDAFSAGADLKEFLAARPALEQALERRRLGALFLLIDAYPKALIAAVNGDALGAGFGLVAACHLAVAAEEAHFGLPGVRLGIMPMTIMPPVFNTLPRKLGLELMLTGRLMTATEAAGVGFVNRVVRAADLGLEATALASAASNNPLTFSE
ncbi:MAG: enoyl-CoA hydratase/isomerase family protein [Chloroflexi bacterium]|nr:MAG: enoyl-CoA hydratase/isomerase family protein [Chloroflexota bacterium]